MADLSELQSHLSASIEDAERLCGRSQRHGDALSEQFWAGVSTGQQQVLSFLQSGHWASRSD